MNCIYASVSESDIMAYVNSSFTISSRLITSNFSAVPIVSHHFFTWIALGDVDVCFLLMLVRKANTVGEETRLAA
jgi:hypothetical protein